MALSSRDRRDFMLRLARMDLSDWAIERFARWASRLDTLNVALCNGDWPCDNGERKVEQCSRCEGGYVPSQLSKHERECPDCRTQDKVRMLALAQGLTVEFSGDPRGMPFKLERAAEVSK